MADGNSSTSNERLTVGALRDFLTAMDGAPLADDHPIMVHVGWDWPVEEMDASDGLLVLLAEIPEGVSFVNFDGLQAMEKSSTAAHRKAMLLDTKNDRQAEIIASQRAEIDALVWHLIMLADITPQRPIRADELEDVLLHGKEVEDDYETAFGLMHHLAEEVITPERRAAAEAWHEARVREAFEKLPQGEPE